MNGRPHDFGTSGRCSRCGVLRFSGENTAAAQPCPGVTVHVEMPCGIRLERIITDRSVERVLVDGAERPDLTLYEPGNYASVAVADVPEPTERACMSVPLPAGFRALDVYVSPISGMTSEVERNPDGTVRAVHITNHSDEPKEAFAGIFGVRTPTPQELAERRLFKERAERLLFSESQRAFYAAHGWPTFALDLAARIAAALAEAYEEGRHAP